MQASANHTNELDQLRVAEHLYRKMQAMQHQRAAVKASGMPALRRLVTVAQGGSGQSAVVSHFLLSLYNGPGYPSPLTDLRALDEELHSDCMAVLMMDWAPEKEVHELIEGGHHIFQSLAARWG